ncbi:hypothetical protein STZ1_10396 [Bacillus subtilis]
MYRYTCPKILEGVNTHGGIVH